MSSTNSNTNTDTHYLNRPAYSTPLARAWAGARATHECRDVIQEASEGDTKADALIRSILGSKDHPHYQTMCEAVALSTYAIVHAAA